MSGGDVLDGRAGNGKQSAGRDRGLAWLRLHKLEKAEDPVDLREIGTGKVHVMIESITELHRGYLAWVAKDSGIESLGPVAEALLTDTGDTTDAVQALKQEGITVPSLGTWARWERAGFRSREIGDGAPTPKRSANLGALIRVRASPLPPPKHTQDAAHSFPPRALCHAMLEPSTLTSIDQS